MTNNSSLKAIKSVKVDFYNHPLFSIGFSGNPRHISHSLKAGYKIWTHSFEFLV